MGSTQLQAWWLGQRPYAPVHRLQERLVSLRQAGQGQDVVLIVEHPPVITLGRGARRENVLVSEDALAARGIEVVETGRGGDVTLHAPGQLVVYPILELGPGRRDVRRYVGDLMETMRRLAGRWDIDAGPVDGLVGLWVDADAPSRWTGRQGAGRLAKIGAIGVRISRWVTMHGFAFNLTTDLDLFSAIVPCGIREHGVTSVAALTGEQVSVGEASVPVVRILAEVLCGEIVGVEDLSGGELEGIEGGRFE
ncbi:MAG: lipoyl(octanoyl) transferase LipB [Polyangiaceae bacterium]|nr:lipoyl(octanoyl) transferase LipB [Polyangiaceae bacterium]